MIFLSWCIDLYRGGVGFQALFFTSDVTEVCNYVCVCSERWGASVRDRRALLGGRRGSQLLRRDAEGARLVGDLLRTDGGLRPGPHHPVAAAGPALPTQRPLRGNNGRVLAGPPPHQVTERR